MEEVKERPPAPQLRADEFIKNCPYPLRKLKQFACWKMDWNEEKQKYDKVSYNAYTGGRAMSNNSNTWSDFQTACEAFNKNPDYCGISIAMGNGLVCVDLDDVVNNGTATDRALDIIKTMRSYTEISPRGKGIHILAFGTLPENGRRKNEVEMYSQGRFLTLTGKLWQNEFTPIGRREPELAAVHEKYVKVQSQNVAPVYEHVDLTLSDKQIIEKLSGGRQSAKFNALYAGDFSSYKPNEAGTASNEADFALCSMIAFYTHSAAQVDAIFRTSGLMRPKWDERRPGNVTYGSITVNKAMTLSYKKYNPTEFYGNNKKNEVAPKTNKESFYFVNFDEAKTKLFGAVKIDDKITSKINIPIDTKKPLLEQTADVLTALQSNLKEAGTLPEKLTLFSNVQGLNRDEINQLKTSFNISKTNLDFKPRALAAAAEQTAAEEMG